MFEKHRNSNQDATPQQATPESFTAPATTPAPVSKAAVIGPGIHINGDIKGAEDLLIEGRVDGEIHLQSNQVDIGQTGKVQADITANVIKIAGEVKGDIKGAEKVIILRTGNVHGNIIAPRMTLEDGAIFKGSIDMDPGEPARVQPAKPAKPLHEKVGEPPKVVSKDALKEGSNKTLNGG